MKKNLVFIGNYGNRNVGDDAILSVLSKRYAQMYPEFDQAVFARFYKDDISRIASARPLGLTLSNVLWVLLHCQLVVIGGGGIFSAYTGPLAKLIPIFAVVCKLLGKRVVFESIGFYQTAGELEKHLVRFAMLWADTVSVRDKASLETVRPILSWKKVTLVDDPGLEIQPISASQAQEILRREGIPSLEGKYVIGISVKRLKNPSQNKNLTKAITEFVKEASQRPNTVLLFVPFCQDKEKFVEKDLEYSQEIISAAQASTPVYVLKNYYPPTQVAGVVKLSSLFVATRFHSIVFGHALQVPLVPLSYEEKCSDFIRKHGYELLTADTVSAVDLLKYLPLSRKQVL